MKRRLSAALLAAVLTLGLLTACGGDKPAEVGAASPVPTQSVKPSTKLDKPPQPEQMIADVNGFAGNGLPENTVVNDCEVIKRQSNPEQKQDIVYCRLTAQDRFRRGEYQLKLLYNFYDEGGWILDEVTPENESAWVDGYLDAADNLIQDDIVWLKGGYTHLDTRGDWNAFIVAYAENNRVALYERSGKYLAMNSAADISDAGQFEKLSDGRVIAAVETNDGWCLMDTEGNRLSAYYADMGVNSSTEDIGTDEVWYYFSRGLGAGTGFVNQDGLEVISLDPVISFRADAIFRYGMCVVQRNNEDGTSAYGAINTAGQLVIPIIYNKISWFREDGTASAKLNGVMGTLDRMGNFQPDSAEEQPSAPSKPAALSEYTYVDNIGGDVYIVQMEQDRQVGEDWVDSYGAAKADGTLLIPCRYDYINRYYYDASGGDLLMVWSGNAYQLYDFEGNCRTPELSFPEELMSRNEFGSATYQYSHLQRYFGPFTYKDGVWGLLPQILTADEIAE